jgi:DNA-binding response OmpR family regulator
MRHPDQLLTRAQLLRHVWGYDHHPGSNVVDAYVHHLRKPVPPRSRPFAARGAA